MLLDYDILFDVLTSAALFFLVYFFLYRKYVVSIFDPTFSYAYSTAFASVLVSQALTDQQYIANYFGCQLFLFFGFVFIQEVSFTRINKKPTFDFHDRDMLVITVYILFSIYILANLYTLSLKGSALFSDDPAARVTNYDNSFGVFKRLNWGVSSFLAAGFTVLYLTKPRRIWLLFILVMAFFTALEGAKSSAFKIIVTVSLIVYHPFFKSNKLVVNKVKKYGPVVILAAFLIFLTVLSKESGSGDDIFLATVRRLLYSADSVLYFYLPQNEYLRTAYKPLDFLPYVAVPITGFLRLAEYNEPFGSIMVENTQFSELKTDVLLAPNTPFYIEGQIFFGYYGAWLYSFFIGSIFSFVRRLFMSLTQGSYFMLALLCTFFFHSSAVLIETNLFITLCLDTCLFVPPVYGLVWFASRQKIVLRKLKFSSPTRQAASQL